MRQVHRDEDQHDLGRALLGVIHSHERPGQRAQDDGDHCQRGFAVDGQQEQRGDRGAEDGPGQALLGCQQGWLQAGSMAPRAAMGFQSALVTCSPKAMATVIANATAAGPRTRSPA